MWDRNEFQEEGGASGKGSAYRWEEMQETQVQSQGQEDPLKKGMATHSSFLAWRTLWTAEPGRPQSMGLQSWTHIGAMLVWHIMTIVYWFLVLVLPVFAMTSSFIHHSSL